MNKHYIKHYPVRNGDTTLISLKDGTKILVDCNFHDDPDYDVKADILKELPKDGNKNPHLDCFILTHPDNDHCRGFDKNFYTGAPENYSENNRKNEEIIIDEIWVTSILFTYDQSQEANNVRNEVNRRLKLYKDQDAKREYSGNRLRLIGYDDNSNFDNVPNYTPGLTITEFNGKTQPNFELFLHAPFAKDVVKSRAKGDRNSSSIVFQGRFWDSENNVGEPHGLALYGGDADHYIWKEIIKQTKAHGGNYPSKLQWHMFLTPHHCSWTFFNNVSYDIPENQTPQTESIEILDNRLGEAKIVASSNKIVEDKPNPPHQPAKDEYVRKVGEKNFLNTSVEPDERNPKPIQFIITTEGPSRSPIGKVKSAFGAAGGAGAAGTVNTTG